jgi:hypothetical protein
MSNRIATAVKSCLDAAANGFGEYPFARVRAVIYGLRADSNWSDAEVMEVQMNVIRVLMTRPSAPLDEPFSAQSQRIQALIEAVNKTPDALI